jgi:hypothetical protein
MVQRRGHFNGLRWLRQHDPAGQVPAGSPGTSGRGGEAPAQGGAKRTLRILVAGASTALLCLVAGNAYAYNGTTAATYADKYALSPNGSYYSFSDDCTNFVSQALRAGGHKFHGTPSGLVLNNNSQWWVYDGGAGRTYSWSVADSLATFINLYDTATPHSQFDGGQAKALPSGVAKGDPVFYIFSDSSTKFGVSSIVIGSGTDPNSKWVGGLIDEHTTNRHHAIWNLIPYNSQWATTSTEEFHMSTAD